MIDRRYVLGVGFLGLAAGLTGFTQKKPAKTPCADPELCAERQSQQGLPRSGDPLWSRLHACAVGYNSKSGLYTLTPTPQVRAMAGTIVRVKGFTLPLDGSDKTSHFLIGINTPVCFYHPPGEPNEVIEVTSVRAIDWTEKPVTVEGVFNLMNNGEMGVFFKLDKARVV